MMMNNYKSPEERTQNSIPLGEKGANKSSGEIKIVNKQKKNKMKSELNIQYKTWLAIILLLFFGISKVSKAQEYDATIGSELPDVDNDVLVEGSLVEDNSESELSGMIIDDTISKIGRDFMSYFFTNWNKPNKQMEYTITVQEKPLPGNGSQILVYVDDYLLFQNFMQPRADVIEDNANYAISMVYSYLENYEQILQQLQDEDLSGSGIF